MPKPMTQITGLPSMRRQLRLNWTSSRTESHRSWWTVPTLPRFWPWPTVIPLVLKSLVCFFFFPNTIHFCLNSLYLRCWKTLINTEFVFSEHDLSPLCLWVWWAVHNSCCLRESVIYGLWQNPPNHFVTQDVSGWEREEAQGGNNVYQLPVLGELRENTDVVTKTQFKLSAIQIWVVAMPDKKL